MDDQKIIGLFWSRSEDAIVEISQKYGKYCAFIAYSILRDREDCEECVNDAYLKLWNTIPPNRPEDLKGYAGRAVRGIALNMAEKSAAKKRTAELLPFDELAEILPEDGGLVTEGVELSDLMNRFVATLGRDARRFFIGRYWYCMTVRELADAWGVSDSKVKMSLLRTREKLKKYLEREGIKV
ncbi:MAG: sigma-70 family RNA polymerase sigma factor [Clostridia bacterium]|nr:sigma-70 family RNA polymerase sigma factor [Clostridia bacterium]